jgi:hypothetical protein
MLIHQYPFLLPERIEDGLSAKLRALADDLDLIRSAKAPTERQYDEAPLIRDWSTALDPTGLRLVGHVADHPGIRSGLAMTSQLWTADRSDRWVRTLSRFYRLGRPSPQNEAEDAHDDMKDFRDV